MKTISRYLMTLVALFAMTTGAWAAAAYYVVGNFTNWSINDAYKMTLNTECTSTTEYMLTLDLAADAQFKVVKDDGQTLTWYPDGMGNNYGENGELSGAGKYTVYFRPNGDGNQDWFYGFMYVAAAEPDPVPGTITLNDTKTIASFTMPTNDVTVDYELVRDMSVQMQAQVGDDPAKEPRYRVQWNDEKETFEPAELNLQQVLALFSVNDLIEKTTLAPTSYFVNIYAVDAEGNPTGDAMTFQNFTFAPGRYAVTATGLPGGPYDGTTALSNIFELFQGYEIKVAAGEYATYYKDEALRVEDQEVELLTITAVEDGKAVLSNASNAMPKETPFLVHNNGTEEKTILLIPCNEPDLAVTVAKEFIGTLTEKTFTEDDMKAAEFYVCNGKEFIKVRGAGTLAANKAYLKVTGNAPASIPFRRSIDGNGEGTTGIDNVNVNPNPNPNLNDNDAAWYDLGGRKLNGKPAQKGIYIKNGRKVVVK